MTKICSNTKVANYAAAYRPTCNGGYGCPACWKKYIEINGTGIAQPFEVEVVEKTWMPTGLFKHNLLKKLAAVVQRAGFKDKGGESHLSVFYDSEGYLNLRFDTRIFPKEKRHGNKG